MQGRRSKISDKVKKRQGCAKKTLEPLREKNLNTFGKLKRQEKCILDPSLTKGCVFIGILLRLNVEDVFSRPLWCLYYIIL